MRKLKSADLQRASVPDFKHQVKRPIVMVLDDVRSMHNVGSIFRTADGFAIERIELCGITARPPHRDIEKTALGATQSVAWRYWEQVDRALHQLKAEGYQLIAIEQVNASVPLQHFKPIVDQKYALIFGNEVHGVSDQALKLIDHCLEIPQFGTKHSFNIVVAAGIVLWDFYSKQLPYEPFP